MHTTCIITGSTLTTSHHFSNLSVTSLHPIFNLSTNEIIRLLDTKASIWDWNEEESKLLFLALAYSSKLLSVDGTATCSPTIDAIFQSWDNLLRIADWKQLRSPDLPTFLVSAANDNSSMEEFPRMLDTIMEHRAISKQQEEEGQHLAQLEELISKLLKQCSIGAAKQATLRSKVAQWAMTAANSNAVRAGDIKLDADTSKHWHKMLTSPSSEAYRFSKADIDELEDFMISNLPHGCNASYEVLQQIQRLRNATTNLADFLGGEIITILPNTPEPVESEFASRTSYLIALAKWRMSTSASAKTAEVIARPAANLLSSI